ncbi:hypothetical protein [Planomicrobium sp. CPCC 101079]|uniref:hypothetical protein n=1 Tax=Planomicrobium sp. CPCC 101079 TaxID=2599618 RepID=UPI0011B4C324|nr:hypothetical protein [Planomicrobium sp. CPCC 101079]TWT04627.1 hypothetical protein FQV28_08470 [Planomicrobium sp. CPCC 101079]
MTYQEMNELKKGDQLHVYHHGWKTGTFQGYIAGADPSAWIAFDAGQDVPSSPIVTRVYTGLQFTEEYWNEKYKGQKFERLSEEELNAELLQAMDNVG